MSTKKRIIKAIIEPESSREDGAKYVIIKGDNSYTLVSLRVLDEIGRDKDDHSIIAGEYAKRVGAERYGWTRYELPGGKMLKVLGGGFLQKNPKNRTIKTFGKSDGYGKVHKSLVKLILAHCYPDFKLDVQVTDYTRSRG